MKNNRNVTMRKKKNYRKLISILNKKNKKSQVLIIGGRTIGTGIKDLINNPLISVIETDIQFGSQVKIIADAHKLPFKNESFDAVIIQAVLEHVVDPKKCVAEIYRVLKKKGLVYSEIPFLIPVHEYPYDFIRYSYLGHRMLFRNFKKIKMGPIAGPGTVLFWQWEYFLVSFFKMNKLKFFLRMFARFSGFWIKYFDYFLLKNVSSYDSSAAFYFMGKNQIKFLKIIN